MVKQYNGLIEICNAQSDEDKQERIGNNAVIDGSFPWISHSNLHGIGLERREMVEKHVFIERCKEEVTILAEEKNKYVQFYRNQMLRLKASIADHTSSSLAEDAGLSSV
eukprot:Seg2833.3 transcript_id=Seg2833.3/GoldUCD/mRNA.D3Y31 product="hypothetical protein" protein_id=Seg2833.3/GoldUCD/D3Y31